ncbi:hypothetical protein [Pseudooceanicola sp.]|uniref:hypothetical protein n=1 Tax=Pseudooceanicola sp. TaxID=1914328 RepID=UPI0040585725
MTITVPNASLTTTGTDPKVAAKGDLEGMVEEVVQGVVDQLGDAAEADAADFATAAQGAKADSAIQPGNAALTDAREWTASTVSQSEAEAGTATDRRAWTAERIKQAIAAWITANLAVAWAQRFVALAGKATPVDADQLGIIDSAASNAPKKLTWANLKATLKTYFDSLYATAAQGSKADSAIQSADLAEVATSGEYRDLSGTPTLGTAAAQNETAFATAAQGAKADSAIQPGNAALTDSREWTADTVSQSEAEAGTATDRRAWSALRVRQAIAAWWAASSAKTALDAATAGVSANATAITTLDTRVDHIAISDVTRPGDAPEQFSSALTGEPEARAAITQGETAVDDDLGKLWSLPGAGIIAPRRAYALEEDRVYRLRVAYKRLVNSSDPSGDAVQLKLRNLNKNKATVSTVTLASEADPAIADGVILLSIVISKDSEATGVQSVPPATARYCTPFIETFGDTPTTDVAFFQWEDITDVVSGGADVAALSSALDAEEDARVAGDATEALARASAITAEATTRANADTAEAAARVAGDAAEASARATAIQQHRDDIAEQVITEELEIGADGDTDRPRLRNMNTGGSILTDATGLEIIGVNSDGTLRLKVSQAVANKVKALLGLADAIETGELTSDRVTLGSGGPVFLTMNGRTVVASGDGLAMLSFDEAGGLEAKAASWPVGELVFGLSGDARARAVPTPAGEVAFATGDGMEALGFDGHKLRMHPADATIARLLGPLGIGAVPVENRSIYCLGDSLTAGTGGGGTRYPEMLETVTGRPVEYLAKGGMVPTQIGAIWGSERIHLTVSGGEIPASGGVAVTSDIDILVSGGLHQVAYTARGFLAGIEDVLSTDTSGNYTFTRSTSGSAVTVDDSNNHFILSVTGTGFIAGRGSHYADTLIIGAGRNGAKGTAAQREAMRDTVRRMIQVQTPRYRNAYVLAVPNSNAEPAGDAAYDHVMALNQLYAAAFGPRFIDWRRYLINYGLYDAGITPTAQDLTEISNDVIPDSFRSDSTHLNADGYEWKARHIASIIR